MFLDRHYNLNPSAAEPANPKELTPRAKSKFSNFLMKIIQFNQGLIGWGTLTFRLVNLHNNSNKSTI